MITWHLKLIATATIIFGLTTSADLANPGEGGGTENEVEGPPLAAPAAPGAIVNPQAGELSGSLRNSLGDSGADVGGALNGRINEIQTEATNTDTVASTYKPGDGKNLRTKLAELRAKVELLEADLAGGSNDNAKQIVREFREKVEQTIITVRQLDAAIENSNTNLGVQVSRDAVGLLARRYGRSFGGRTTAGGLFSDWQFSLNYSYADFDDDEAAGGGTENEFGFLASASMADNIEVGFGLSQVRWKLETAANDIERHTITPEAYLNYAINDTFAWGLFLSYAETDIESEIISDPILGAFDIADQFGRWAAGTSLSAHKSFGDHDIGVTTALTSANKASLTDIFDVTDTAALAMFDLQSIWSDSWNTAVYATYYTLVDRESNQGDGSFWFVGGDVSHAFNDRIRGTIGYETTLGIQDFSEHRLNVSIEYLW